MIHSISRQQLNTDITSIQTFLATRIGKHVNLLVTSFNAVQNEFLNDEEKQFGILKAMWLVLVSMKADIDVTEQHRETYLTIPDRFYRIFYDNLSQLTNMFLSGTYKYDFYVQRCEKLQNLFVNWDERGDGANQRRENIGVILAAASRDETSRYYGLHALLEKTFMII